MMPTPEVTPEFEALIDELIKQPAPPPGSPTFAEIIEETRLEELLRRKRQAGQSEEPEMP